MQQREYKGRLVLIFSHGHMAPTLLRPEPRRSKVFLHPVPFKTIASMLWVETILTQIVIIKPSIQAMALAEGNISTGRRPVGSFSRLTSFGRFKKESRSTRST
jgi:hypothetical protein